MATKLMHLSMRTGVSSDVSCCSDRTVPLSYDPQKHRYTSVLIIDICIAFAYN